MTDNPNRPEPTKPFKRKNYARIFGSCKGEKLVDDGAKWAPCKKCGDWNRKNECPFCHTKREKK